MQTVDSRAAEKQLQIKLYANRWKIKILKKYQSQQFENQTKYFYIHLSKCFVSYGGIAQQCTNLSTEASGEWEIGIRVIPIPICVHSHPSHSQSQVRILFPLPWDSRGIPIPTGDRIPVVISTLKQSQSPLICLDLKPISASNECPCSMQFNIKRMSCITEVLQMTRSRTLHLLKWSTTMI